MKHQHSNRRSARGFSLMELAVILGVVGILFTSVMIMHGYAEGARITAGVQLVDTLEKAARSWATRYTNRTGFITTSGTQISMLALSNAGLVDAGLVTPWGSVPSIAPRVGQPEWVVIQVTTNDPESAIDLANTLQGKGQVSRAGSMVQLITH